MVAACASVGLSSMECNDDHFTVEVLVALLENLYNIENSGVLDTDLHCPVKTGASCFASTKSAGKKGQKCSREGNRTGAVQSGSPDGHQCPADSAIKPVCTDKMVCIEMLINLMLNLFDQ